MSKRTGYFATRFTRRFGLVHPFAGAGLAFAGQTPDLAIAVTKAGGIGALGVGAMPAEQLREYIRLVRDATDGPFNINFITCFDNDAQIRVCAEEKVPVVSFHWGHPSAIHLRLLLDAGCSIWEQVGSVEDGKRSVGDGVEVIIPQGWEAGGHNYGGLGTVAFVPAMVDAIGDEALILASGGISDARGVAAALTLGADGVWVGTRLVAAQEAHVHPYHHSALIAAQGNETVRSSIFWPEMPHFNPMRLLRNRVVEEYTDRLADVPLQRDHLPVVGETIVNGEPHTKRKFDGMLPVPETTGDFEEMPWLSGQGVGLIHNIKPAAAIVEDMMSGAADIFRNRIAGQMK
ncbi:MAG TPA: nitronate monooxygenase [Sphingomicrobium sp.]|nr:nitronate monooxygenase [Sphingomicrobium sp.]